MATTKTRVKLTYQDYLNNTPPDSHSELLDGEIIMKPGEIIPHQRALLKLGIRVGEFVERRDMGEALFAPMDVVLSNNDVVQPDLLFISRDRMSIITYDNIQGAPDLVVEVLSPYTIQRDLTFKRALYAHRGIKEYWQVDIDDRRVTVLLLGDNDYEFTAIYGSGDTLTSPVLPGFTLAIDEIF